MKFGNLTKDPASPDGALRTAAGDGIHADIDLAVSSGAASSIQESNGEARA